MTGSRDRILLYGYGNPGRGDDGLGPAWASALEGIGASDVVVDANYQLTVEDAVEIQAYGTVIFADAAMHGPAPFCFTRIDEVAKVGLGWTSHSVGPAELVALTRLLFGSCVQAYTLGIRGYQFAELEQALSLAAKENLAAAVTFAKNALVERRFDDYVCDVEVGPTCCR